jgi:multiple sugar transport system ATP-binding protein
MAKVEFDDVSKVFDDGTRAVDRLDLDVADGEFMVLVGPSGCGKTTALRMVAGLEEISGGTVRIGDRVVNELTPKNRDIAMVFQSYALYPHLTVRDNIAFPLRLARLAKDEIGRRIGGTARTLDLEPYLERKPRALSGGQRQRVAMGRAIVREPKAFLMDEPLSNLDAKLRVRMRADIKKLQSDLGVTTIYVTHDQVEAMTMGDRVAVMRKGRLQQVAPPEELYERPANIFVAGFIGSPPMNILEARVESGTAVIGDVRIPVRCADGDVLVGIRPESFEDAALANGDGRPRLRARVELREALGSEVLVHFSTAGRLAATDELRELAEDSGDDRAAERATLVGRFSSKTLVREGDTIEVAIDVDSLHVFDPRTGAALQARP